jgi:uracil-DNA glycosylase
MSDTALDDRQRHMLEAMGIKLWQAPAQAAPTPAGLTGSESAVQASVVEPNRPLAHIEKAPSATKNVASIPSQTRSAQTPSPPTATPANAQPSTSSTNALASRPVGIEQMAWPALQSAVASCQACGLCQSRKKTVFGVGPGGQEATEAPRVDWLIVGEAPGEQEDIAGEPFVGPAGKLLDNMLAAMKTSLGLQGKPMDLSRTQGSYIANVLKCRPPANRNPSPEEVGMCTPYLARQIELLRPKIIVAMGKFAITSLTGSTEAVGKLRGRVHALQHPSYAAPVIVTYHPAYLLRNLPDKAKAWADLQLAMQTYLALPSGDSGL